LNVVQLDMVLPILSVDMLPMRAGAGLEVEGLSPAVRNPVGVGVHLGRVRVPYTHAMVLVPVVVCGSSNAIGDATLGTDQYKCQMYINHSLYSQPTSRRGKTI
jgi:hypothetical protein